LLLESVVVSTLLYYYLHTKTRISLKFLFIDNIGVIVLSTVLAWLLTPVLAVGWQWILFLIIPALAVGIAFGFTMIRFWRTPKRRISAGPDEIVSPADGNVIYITRVEAGEVPVSIKGNRYSRLEELTKTDLLDKPCWLVGINMTPFDVHKNCAPIDGKVLLNQHFDGKFLSLKESAALTENERNTYVLANEEMKVGIVQIASRLVRRIDTYVRQGAELKKGEWLGMIRFGSQVDVILPADYEIMVQLKDQIYAGTTILAKKK
ncbi:MAG: phosphatidylserine decarboxylase family protein, partial [Phaeodactylibacter sp.]|nr:phosphatidylserine decarboxylase family protein [Phaeodactylibacter sp.]